MTDKISACGVGLAPTLMTLSSDELLELVDPPEQPAKSATDTAKTAASAKTAARLPAIAKPEIFVFIGVVSLSSQIAARIVGQKNTQNPQKTPKN
jgi:hypothetical protein